MAARTFDTLIAPYPPEIQSLARDARSFLRGLLPDADEAIDASAPYAFYSYGPGYRGVVCNLMISKTGASNWIALPHNIESLIQAVRSFAIVGWFGIEIGMVLFLSACVDLSTEHARRFVLLALLFAVPGLLFGWVEDVRVFLPCAVMMCFAVAAHKEA